MKNRLLLCIVIVFCAITNVMGADFYTKTGTLSSSAGPNRIDYTVTYSGGNVIVTLKPNSSTGITTFSAMSDAYDALIYRVGPDGSHMTLSDDNTSLTYTYATSIGNTFSGIYFTYKLGNSEENTVAYPFTYTVASAEDTTAPTNLTASVVEGSISYSSVNLNLSASDDVGVAGYKIYNGQTLLSTITSLTDGVGTLTGLTSNTTYGNLSVVAFDVAGNVSQPVTLPSFTTLTQKSQCEGDLGHFATGSTLKIHYAISYSNGNALVTVNPLDAARTLKYIEAQLLNAGGYAMTISDDGKTATYTFSNYNVNDVLNIRFLYELDDMNGGREMTANSSDQYLYYKVGDCAVPTGIVQPESVNGLHLYVADKNLTIVADKAQTVNIYNVNGSLAVSYHLNVGNNTINLLPGVYVLKHHKIVIK